jgi:hypothetical protein
MVLAVEAYMLRNSDLPGNRSRKFLSLRVHHPETELQQPVRTRHSRRYFTLLLGLILEASGGCSWGEFCKWGDARCTDDGYAENCRGDEGSRYWERKSCQLGSCVIAPDIAMPAVATCSEQSVQDPLCKGGYSPYCDGNELVECTSGFATGRVSCTTGYEMFPSSDTVRVNESTNLTCRPNDADYNIADCL